MAAEKVTISGIQFVGKSLKGEAFNFVGYLGKAGLVVDGGPIIPDPPPEYPNPPPGSVVKPPPPDGGWGWSPEHGWGYFPGPTQPGPK